MMIIKYTNNNDDDDGGGGEQQEKRGTETKVVSTEANNSKQ